MPSRLARPAFAPLSLAPGLFACAALAAAGCGSDPAAPPPPPVDAGRRVVDVPMEATTMFQGLGSVAVTWTVNGQPPAAGCAMAGASMVQLGAGLASATAACTDGQAMIADLPASMQSVSGILVNDAGATIYAYSIPANIMPHQTTNVELHFEPAGTLQVNWTINGAPAAASCDGVHGYGVALEFGFGSPINASLGRQPYVACQSGRFRFPMVQSGNFTLNATLNTMMGGSLGTQTVPVMITSGQTTTIPLDFTTM